MKRSTPPTTLGAMAHPLETSQGRAALELAMQTPDPSSVGAAQLLRRDHAPELAAAALSQAQLRRRAHRKFGDLADGLLFTRDGLEQATRPRVAAWRAARIRSAGVTRVIDLGCGIGADAMACAEAGLDVVAVDLDPETAGCAEHNLTAVGGGRVLVGDVTELAHELLTDADEQTAVFLDPARRTARGRTWRIEDVSPPWTFVESMRAGPWTTVLKLGPGVPDRLLPTDAETLVISDHGDVVEVGVWHGPAFPRERAAVVLTLDAGHRVAARPDVPALPIGPPATFVAEPDPAVIRAHVIAEAVAGHDAWLLDAQIAYVASSAPIDNPFLTSFEVLDVLDAHEKSLRRWVRDHNIGTLEIKKRGVELDPAELRRRLKPSGRAAATLIVTPTTDGVRALHVRRSPWTRQSSSICRSEV